MKPAPSVESMTINVADRIPEEAVAQLIEHAARLYVSDVFFRSNEDHMAVAARHLGILRPLSFLPTDMGRRCLGHIKALAGMDVSERRRPMDGRWIFARQSGHRLDL